MSTTGNPAAAAHPPDINRRIAACVHAHRTGRALTLEALARRSGVSRSMLSLIERGECSPTAVILEKVAAGLGVALASLFDDTADLRHESVRHGQVRDDRVEHERTSDGQVPRAAPAVNIVDCRYAMHGRAILDIFNEAIAHSTAVYDYEPRTAPYIQEWFHAKEARGHPVLGALDTAGNLLGFSSYGIFRDRPAYKYSLEHSVYVHKDHRGKGVGRTLLGRLIDHARSEQHHVLVGGIDLANAASIALHEALGFSHAGTIRQAGFKFGRWLDLCFYQLVLDTPHQPVDG